MPVAAITRARCATPSMSLRRYSFRRKASCLKFHTCFFTSSPPAMSGPMFHSVQRLKWRRSEWHTGLFPAAFCFS